MVFFIYRSGSDWFKRGRIILDILVEIMVRLVLLGKDLIVLNCMVYMCM